MTREIFTRPVVSEVEAKKARAKIELQKILDENYNNYDNRGITADQVIEALDKATYNNPRNQRWANTLSLGGLIKPIKSKLNEMLNVILSEDEYFPTLANLLNDTFVGAANHDRFRKIYRLYRQAKFGY